MRIGGRLERVGSSQLHNGHWKVTVLEVGGESVRNVHVPPYLHDYLEVGEQTELLISKVLWQKTLFGVKTLGRTYTQGTGRLVMMVLVGSGITIGAVAATFGVGVMFVPLVLLAAVLACQGVAGLVALASFRAG